MKRLELAEYVNAHGQAKTAEAIGVTQGAISKALRVGRKIFINQLPDGKVEAEEHRPFPSPKNIAA